jgi:group I intron endonuclease
MLIWSTYFQKQTTALCNNVLGINKVSGIYKITNLKSGLCYIGQSTDIAERWKTHIKCGLGIDTPVQNKLYKAMQIDGIVNFTFELLEKCDKQLLNEKEKFYIDLYQSYNYGYNSTQGNK